MANRQESPPGRQRMLFIISPSRLRTVYSIALPHQYIMSTSLASPARLSYQPVRDIPGQRLELPLFPVLNLSAGLLVCPVTCTDHLITG